MPDYLFPGGLHGKITEPQRFSPIVDADGNLLTGLTAAMVNLLAGGNAVARTATVAGATTGTIADAGMLQVIAVTASSAAHIIKLPSPTPGTIVVLMVGANGYELVTSDAATIALGGNTPSAAHSSAIPANSVAVAFCISATAWVGLTITGQTLAAIETAA